MGLPRVSGVAEAGGSQDGEGRGGTACSGSVGRAGVTSDRWAVFGVAEAVEDGDAADGCG